MGARDTIITYLVHQVTATDDGGWSIFRPALALSLPMPIPCAKHMWTTPPIVIVPIQEGAMKASQAISREPRREMGIAPFEAKGIIYNMHFGVSFGRAGRSLFIFIWVVVVGGPTSSSTAETWLRAFDLVTRNNQRQSGAIGTAVQHDEATMRGGWWPAHF